MLASQRARPASRTLPTCLTRRGFLGFRGWVLWGCLAGRLWAALTLCSSPLSSAPRKVLGRCLPFPGTHRYERLSGSPFQPCKPRSAGACTATPGGPQRRRSLSPSVAAAGLWAPAGHSERHWVQCWPLPRARSPMRSSSGPRVYSGAGPLSQGHVFSAPPGRWRALPPCRVPGGPLGSR